MGRALVNVPATAKAGDIVEIKALVAHPMETGYRREALGAAIPRNIVTRFVCTWNAEVVFAADLFPAIAANPYFAFASMLLAGIDGIQNKIHPGDPGDKDLYDLEPEEDKKIPTVCHSLDMALDYLDKDRGFLKAGGVFTDDLIDAYIELKMKEVTRVRMTTHPIEVEMYYSL